MVFHCIKIILGLLSMSLCDSGIFCESGIFGDCGILMTGILVTVVFW